jgi:hypothetical protein
MKLSIRYEQISCRLLIEGLPDLSAGQSAETIGILTGFTLALAGQTELEGRLEHLQALIAAVMPYARHLLSAQPRPFGAAEDAVAIAPSEAGHRLELRSSQPDTPPLALQLDDAELADLVRCLDQLRLDPRLAIALSEPQPLPLRRRELRRREPLRRRLAAPAAGLAALVISGALAWLLPPTPRPAAPGTTPAPARPR